MNGKNTAALLVAATLTGALGMSACGSGDTAGPTTPSTSTPSSTSPSATSPDPSGAPAATPTPPPPATEPLALNDWFKSVLGDAYAEGWIEDGTLHVAVTSEVAATQVAAAGAVAAVVPFNAARLQAALDAVTAWRAGLPAAEAAAIHTLFPSGRTGSLTLTVDPTQLAAVRARVQAEDPAGGVPVQVEASPGLPTALSSAG